MKTKSTMAVTYKTIGYKSYDEMWKDFINNFLTIQGFADYYMIKKTTAVHLLDRQGN